VVILGLGRRLLAFGVVLLLVAARPRYPGVAACLDQLD
jgi:hypothetical protein